MLHAIEIAEEFHIRNNISDIVVQESEIIRVKLSDYFGGSFLTYIFFLDDPEELTSPNPEFISITDRPFELVSEGNYVIGTHVRSLSDTMRLLLIQQRGKKDSTFVFYIDEEYLLRIADFSDYDSGTAKEVYTLNLLSSIYKITGKVNILDIYCNGLSTVIRDNLYIIGCNHKGQSFLLWINLVFSKNKFSAKVIQQKSEFSTDSLGENFITTFILKNFAFLVGSSTDYNNYIQVSVFDISKYEEQKIEHIYTGVYTSFQFSNPFSKDHFLSTPFNLRDSIAFSSLYIYGDNPTEMNNYIVASCYNNGLLFFKSTQTSLLEGGDLTGLELLNLTYIYNIPNIGKIYTEKAYRLDSHSDIFFFTSSPSPPIVYEFLINEYMNVNIRRIYKNTADPLRYIGNDNVNVNDKYVAMLVYDFREEVQVIRVYNRIETNRAIGHVDIPLVNFVQRISGFTFLSYMQNNRVFIRGSDKWEMYDISDHELKINTKDYSQSYLKYTNKTLNAVIQACSRIA